LKKLISGLVLFTVIALGFASAADAAFRHSRDGIQNPHPCETEIDYYSDSSMDNIVGWYIVYCDGTIDSGGTVTSYSATFHDLCDPS